MPQSSAATRKAAGLGDDKDRKSGIQYDAQGNIVKDALNLLNERPNYQVYPCDEEHEVECVFCHGISSDQEMRKNCGPLYGPIKLKKAKASNLTFVHELCALWTPEIYLNDQNKFKGLQIAMERTEKHRCAICQDKGAGLGC